MQLKKYIPSSSRRKARSISGDKLKLMEEFFPTIGVKHWSLRLREAQGGMENLKKEYQNKVSEIIFSAKNNYRKIFLEIGFGGGEHLMHIARNNPDALIIGSEVFYNSLCACVQKIHSEKLENIRIFDGDVRLLLEEIEKFCANEGSHFFDKVFVLFPDPWPKSRHEKRRLVSLQFLDMLHKVMKPEGVLRIATDHNIYFNWVLEVLGKDKRFQKITSDTDYAKMPADHIITKYQEKAIYEGRVPRWVEYSR